MGTPLSLEVRMRDLQRATENWHTLIDNMAIETPLWFKNQVPMGMAELGKGYTRTKYRFHNMIVDQGGLENWDEVVQGRAPGTNGPSDPGYDPCATDADIVDFGLQAVTYKPYRRQLKTKDICLPEFMFDWEWEQQFRLFFESLPQMGLQLWENLFQELFMNFSQKYVLVGGNPRQVEFTYDPFTSQNITIASAPANISTFNWGPFPYLLEYLTAERPQSAQATVNGAPAWPLVMNGDDFMSWLDRNARVRGDMHHAEPTVMLENWAQSLPTYRGFPRVSKTLMPRWNRTAAGTYTRVLPYDESSTGMQFGNRERLTSAYQEAEYSVAFIMPKRWMQANVPPLVTRLGGAAEFKTQVTYGGDFRFICNPDNDKNELGEKGKFFLRIMAFAEPLENSEYPITLFYRRCIGETISLCDDTVQKGAGSVDIVAGSVANGDGFLFTATLASILPCETGPVTITDANGQTYNGYIGASSGAPSYTFVGDADRDWATLLATGSIVCASGSL